MMYLTGCSPSFRQTKFIARVNDGNLSGYQERYYQEGIYRVLSKRTIIKGIGASHAKSNNHTKYSLNYTSKEIGGANHWCVLHNSEHGPKDIVVLCIETSYWSHRRWPSLWNAGNLLCIYAPALALRFLVKILSIEITWTWVIVYATCNWNPGLVQKR